MLVVHIVSSLSWGFLIVLGVKIYLTLRMVLSSLKKKRAKDNCNMQIRARSTETAVIGSVDRGITCKIAAADLVEYSQRQEALC